MVWCFCILSVSNCIVTCANVKLRRVEVLMPLHLGVEGCHLLCASHNYNYWWTAYENTV